VIQHLTSHAGVAGPLVFVVLEAAITLLFLPRAAGAVVAGALFGIAAGTLLTWLAMMLGAVVAFWIGRAGRRAGGQLGRFASDRRRARIGPWVERLNRWMERRGSIAVLYSRLIPGMPFTSINYAAGMTTMRWRPFVVATALGVLPNAYLLVALGGSFDHPLSVRFIVIAGVIVALAIAAPIVDGAVRRRMHPGAGAPA
jgi:uncharacterized membrane protein YdjX (TVP38/TMEM64 family)